MDNGTIMFNTERARAKMERKDGKGQGDLYEGVYATCGLYDIPSIKEYHNAYEDVEPENDGKLVYFKRSSVIDMPSFCFSLLKQSLFNRPVKEGIQKLEAIIHGRYFKDFADDLNKDEVMKLKEESL
ncbi:hypothetical protein [Wukongibacter sp. M2B1]|uniref:hypothetical protein n=1 Tax=Wukongibacter sp. M2B1 TaxID=3088895 RepID=UPI003D78C9C7